MFPYQPKDSLGTKNKQFIFSTRDKIKLIVTKKIIVSFPNQTIMKRVQLLLLVVLIIGTSAILIDSDSTAMVSKRQMNVEEMSVEDVLVMLGDDTLIHSISIIEAEKVKIGEELVRNGNTVRNGKKTNRISKHFVCTDCHNLTSEFKDISSQAADDRLNYAIENDQPFLPASTFWGIYNRTSFYNKDYEKKYGDLVLAARDSLENAVQVCAKYCSSGRYLEDWELESIMHYYKSLELKIKDLNLPEPILKSIRMYGQLKPDEKDDLISTIKKSYVRGYDATFLETMPRKERNYGKDGDAKKGEAIYEKSCLHCHGGSRVTYMNLSKSKLDAKYFWKNRKNYSDQSLYQIVRHGTFAKTGRQQYMPLFTEEKMSDSQLNDLMAYIKQLAGK